MIDKRRTKEPLVLGLPYLLVGLLATNLGKAWRLTEGADLSAKTFSFSDALPIALNNSLPSFHPLDLLIGILYGAGFRLTIYLKGEDARRYRRSVEYGSARWGTTKDIEPLAAQKFEDNVTLTKIERLMMSNHPKNLTNVRSKNVLIIGGSGPGKTRLWLKPNLLQVHSSYVVTDPRGSIVIECGSALLKYGYTIKVFNTIDSQKSIRYNPFAYIHLEKDILKLVTTLIANIKGDGEAGNEFWAKTETLPYCTLIGYIHYEAPAEEQNSSTLTEFLNAVEAREDDEEFQNLVDLTFEAPEKKKPNHSAVHQYKKYELATGVIYSKRLPNQAGEKSLKTHNPKPRKRTQTMRKNGKITALYERPSHDGFDKGGDQQRENNSISNQKAMLEKFAVRQGFMNIAHFMSDGTSGTCFDRPRFLAMMKEVEAGNAEYLCLKDTSRIGRDYLKVGQIMEILRQRGVRSIAINDGVDSARGDDNFTPFRNIMSEYYTRDTSRKIRSIFQSEGKLGGHFTDLVIYDYFWNEAWDQWLVDPEAAGVVERTFTMTIGGYGPYQITSKLKSEKIFIPSAYLVQYGEGVNKNRSFKDVYGWDSSTIYNILEKREYSEHTINFRTRRHFKDKKSHYIPENEWTIFENTHGAIISQQTFNPVQKTRSKVRCYPNGWGETVPFTGLLYCAGCGGKMYVHCTSNGKRTSQYTYSQYSKIPVGKFCVAQHHINEDVALSFVSDMLRTIAEYAKHDCTEFARVVQEAQSSRQTAATRKQRTRLVTAKQRVSELEAFLCKIYEDNVLGKLSDGKYATLGAQCAKEQSEFNSEITSLEKVVDGYEKHEKDINHLTALIDKYENFDKLTIVMLNEFIEKTLMHEREHKGNMQTTQEVEIYFNFVECFVPPAFDEVELTPEELEGIRKREEHEDRLHQNYLKRKVSGAQK